MNEEQIKIRDQQKESWNKFSGGWKKWDDTTMEFLGPAGDEIIKQIVPKLGDKVLDIAAGTGEPGLTIAGMIGDGKVIITDLAEDMLVVAREKAEAKGISNIETMACDVSELPFDDNSFDAVSCRFGFMFFPDMAQAAKEMVRVLKPGGRLATSVWCGPEKNFWVTSVMNTIKNNMELPPPVPGAPGMFRCAAPGLIADLFRQAGLNDVSEKEVATKLSAGTTDRFWEMMTEIGAPIVAALSKADEATRAKIKKEMYEAVNERYLDGNVNIDAACLVIAGSK